MQDKHVALHDALGYLFANTASDHTPTSTQRCQVGAIRKCHSPPGFGGPIKQTFGLRCSTCCQQHHEFNIGMGRQAGSHRDAFSLIWRKQPFEIGVIDTESGRRRNPVFGIGYELRDQLCDFIRQSGLIVVSGEVDTDTIAVQERIHCDSFVPVAFKLEAICLRSLADDSAMHKNFPEKAIGCSYGSHGLQVSITAQPVWNGPDTCLAIGQPLLKVRE